MIWKNVLKKGWITDDLLDVLSSDKVSFKDNSMQQEYEEILEEYNNMRENSPLTDKLKWRLVEIVWTTFAYMWLDQLLSKLHEIIFQRKKKDV